jgi:hypothetical protein
LNCGANIETENLKTKKVFMFFGFVPQISTTRPIPALPPRQQMFGDANIAHPTLL